MNWLREGREFAGAAYEDLKRRYGEFPLSVRLFGAVVAQGLLYFVQPEIAEMILAVTGGALDAVATVDDLSLTAHLLLVVIALLVFQSAVLVREFDLLDLRREPSMPMGPPTFPTHPDHREETAAETSSEDSVETSGIGAVGGAIGFGVLGATLGLSFVFGGALIGLILGHEYERRTLMRRRASA